MRRAAPLPNSVRFSAVIFSAAISGLLVQLVRGPRRHDGPAQETGPVDHGIAAGAGSPSPRQPHKSRWRSSPCANRQPRSLTRLGEVSLTLAEARARAASLSDVSYDVELDLRDVAAD